MSLPYTRSSQEEAGDAAEIQPFVSVIIPVRNASRHIRHCLDALMQQTYPRDCFEVLVVDNGSTDQTRQMIADYPVLSMVNDSKPSPYVARNEGIRHARGEVLVFLDGDCVPVVTWLASGVQALYQQSADLVGGEVGFTLSPARTASEMLDSISHVNMQASIETRNACMTANLFVRRYVPETIGLFPEHVRSGGDISWTAHATRSGFRLIYSAETQVWKPARPFLPLMHKLYRTGFGVAHRWQDDLRTGRLSERAVIRVMVLGFLPTRLHEIKRRIIARGTVDMLSRVPMLWWLNWLMRITHNTARIMGLLRLLAKR